MVNILLYLVKRSIQSPFALSGRRNRVDYVTYQMIVTVIALCVWLFEQFLRIVDGTGFIHWLFLFPTMAVFLGAAVSLLAAGAQRCRDIGWPGWSIFLCFLPLAGHVFWILLLLLLGTEGEHRYGRPPAYCADHELRA